MYRTILVPVENRETDQTILKHIRPLARLANSKLMLVHVADGWVARNYENFKLRESEEMRQDRAYLANLERELQAEGFDVTSVLAMGEPAEEIIKLARAQPVELIAMSTHGHRFISDLLYGSTADKVRHKVDIPVLLLKVKR
jgi:nucleotide-binding universal stress UspA family protein